MENIIDGLRRYAIVERILSEREYSNLLLNTWYALGDDFYDNTLEAMSIEHQEPKDVVTNFEYLFHCRNFIKDNLDDIMHYNLKYNTDFRFNDYVVLANQVVKHVVINELLPVIEVAKMSELSYKEYYNN